MCFRKLLIKLKYRIEECKNQKTNTTEDCVILLSAMSSNNTSDNETDASGYESDTNKCVAENEHYSDWDEPFTNQWSCETGISINF